MQTYRNNTVKHEQKVNAKSHKKFKARRKSFWTIRKTCFIFLVLESYMRTP